MIEGVELGPVTNEILIVLLIVFMSGCLTFVYFLVNKFIKSTCVKDQQLDRTINTFMDHIEKKNGQLEKIGEHIDKLTVAVNIDHERSENHNNQVVMALDNNTRQLEKIYKANSK